MQSEFEMIGKGIASKINQSHDASIRKMGDEKLLIQSSLVSGSEIEYKKALLLEKLRDALLEQTKYLMEEVNDDICNKSKSLAPRIHGWNNDYIPGLSANLRRKKKPMKFDKIDYESAWENLRGLETQSYRLEDPGIANDFFLEIQEMLINDGLKGAQQKHLVNYPWLLPKSKQIFSHPLLVQKKKKIVTSKVEKIPKKTISQQRLEKDLEEKEIELRKIQSIRFQANPIPASSLIPKYHELIQKHGTKSTEARQKANFNFIAKLNEEKRRAKEASAPNHFTAKQIEIAPKVSRRRNTITSEDEYTFKPKISQRIPDFKKAQEEFEMVLENSRSQKSTTIPVPFAMLSRVKKNNSKLQEVQLPERRSPVQAVGPSQKIIPKTTRSAHLKLKRLEEQREAAALVELLEDEEKQVKEENNRAVAERIRMRLSKTADHETERQAKLKKHQDYQKSLEKSFEEKKAEMKQRIDSRRCLFERVQLDAARNQARSKVNMVLKAAGVEVIGLCE